MQTHKSLAFHEHPPKIIRFNGYFMMANEPNIQFYCFCCKNYFENFVLFGMKTISQLHSINQCYQSRCVCLCADDVWNGKETWKLRSILKFLKSVFYVPLMHIFLGISINFRKMQRRRHTLRNQQKGWFGLWFSPNLVFLLNIYSIHIYIKYIYVQVLWKHIFIYWIKQIHFTASTVRRLMISTEKIKKKTNKLVWFL